MSIFGAIIFHFTIRWHQIILFSSTNVPRTIESLQHILQGLYSQKPHFVPNIRVRYASSDVYMTLDPFYFAFRNTKEESLLGYMESCPKLRSMSTENKRGIISLMSDFHRSLTFIYLLSCSN